MKTLSINPILVAPELQEQVRLNVKSKLPKHIQTQLSKAYFQLYFGLSCINWQNKNVRLGQAWQKALTQIDTFVKSRKNNGPAKMFLQEINKNHLRTWPKNIMTSPDNETTLQCDENTHLRWKKYSTSQIKSAIATINLILVQFRVRTKTMPHENGKNVPISEKQPTPQQNTGSIQKMPVLKQPKNLNDMSDKRNKQADTIPTQKAVGTLQEQQRNAQIQADKKTENTNTLKQTNEQSINQTQKRTIQMPKCVEKFAEMRRNPNFSKPVMQVVKKAETEKPKVQKTKVMLMIFKKTHQRAA